MGRTNNKYDLGTLTTNTQTEMKKSFPFRNQGFTLITTGFTGTVSFFASNADQQGTTPDLSATADGTNEYSETQVIDLSNGAKLDAGTGKVFTGANTSVTRYEMNDNNNNFVGIKTSSVTAGSVVIRLDLTDNQ